MRVLLSAFQPFNGRRRNTSADLLRKVCMRTLLARSELQCRRILLPVDFDSTWPRLLRWLNLWKPDLLILTGEGKSNLITLELVAHNHRKSESDNLPIDQNLPFVLHSVAAEQLATALRAIEGVSIEYDAGDYLCNYTYFQCLSHLIGQPVIFLHVHPLPEDAGRSQFLRIKTIYERVIRKAIELQLRKHSPKIVTNRKRRKSN